MVIFFNFLITSNHLYPLQIENCDSNSRLVVDEDDNGKFRLERVNQVQLTALLAKLIKPKITLHASRLVQCSHKKFRESIF